MAFIFVVSRRKAYSWEIFLQASVIELIALARDGPCVLIALLAERQAVLVSFKFSLNYLV